MYPLLSSPITGLRFHIWRQLHRHTYHPNNNLALFQAPSIWYIISEGRAAWEITLGTIHGIADLLGILCHTVKDNSAWSWSK